MFLKACNDFAEILVHQHLPVQAQRRSSTPKEEISTEATMLETRPRTSTEVRASVVLTSNVPKAWDTPPRQHKAAPAVKRMLRARPLAGTWRHYAVLRSRAALLEMLVKDGGGCTWQGEQATRQCRMAGNKLIATSKGTKGRREQARPDCVCTLTVQVQGHAHSGRSWRAETKENWLELCKPRRCQ